MNQNDLKKFVEDNPKLVTMKESIRYPGLFVLKYSRKVFYDGLWNDFLEECRGTIVDKDFNVISRPFTKIYNYGVEEKSPVLADNDTIVAYRKVNGFMVAVTWYKGDLLVSTTGSTDSDFVQYAYDHIDVEKYRAVCKLCPNTTFMFECVHKSDPHIVPETEGMYLLGYRKKAWDNDCIPDVGILSMYAREFDCFMSAAFKTTIGQLKELVKYVEHEGFVFYTEEGVSAKIKSPYYLTLKAIARKKDILSLDKARVDEEYYPLLNHIKEDITSFNELTEQERLDYIRNYLECSTGKSDVKTVTI